MKKNDDGSENLNYVDLLEEDKPISGQKFACLSFVSPEHIIKQREQFFFEEFLKQWNYKKSMDVMLHFISFVSYKYNLTFDKVNEDFQDFKDGVWVWFNAFIITHETTSFLVLTHSR